MAASYVFSNALMNTFCFPVYMFPVFLIVPLAFHTFMVYKLEKYAVKQNDRDLQPLVINSTKPLIVQYFEQYTNLPSRIIDVIVYQYYEMPAVDIRSHLQAKHAQYSTLYGVYSFVMMAAHFLSFALIIWINVEWSMHNLTGSKFDGWHTFQSVYITLILFVPKGYCMMALMSIVPQWKNDQMTAFQSLLTVIFMLQFLIGYIIFMCGFFIYEIPSMFYHIPVWMAAILILGCVFLCCALIDNKMQTTMKETYVPMVVCMVICVVYFHFMYVTSSMACVYSKQITKNRWYLCLEAALYSPYCPDTKYINVNWTDWRSITLFVVWLLLLDLVEIASTFSPSSQG